MQPAATLRVCDPRARPAMITTSARRAAHGLPRRRNNCRPPDDLAILPSVTACGSAAPPCALARARRVPRPRQRSMLPRLLRLAPVAPHVVDVEPRGAPRAQTAQEGSSDDDQT